MHTLNILHRDLKPSNILLTKKKVVKLCDLGTSKKIDILNANSYVGTLLYMAPEIIRLKNNDEDKVKLNDGYNIFVDVWSIGVILY
jgi:serine/threonine protein kinase